MSSQRETKQKLFHTYIRQSFPHLGLYCSHIIKPVFSSSSKIWSKCPVRDFISMPVFHFHNHLTTFHRRYMCAPVSWSIQHNVTFAYESWNVLSTAHLQNGLFDIQTGSLFLGQTQHQPANQTTLFAVDWLGLHLQFIKLAADDVSQKPLLLLSSDVNTINKIFPHHL